MKLKYIPNIMGLYRIIASITLIPLFLILWIGGEPFSSESTLAIVALVIFMSAGLTDIFDGTVARAIPGAQSRLGATIDGIADMTLVFVSFVFFIPIMDTGSWVYPAFLIGMGFKLAVGLFGQFRHKELSILLHTYSMKALGFILFLTPIIYFFSGGAAWTEIYMIFALCAIGVVVTEELLINIMLKGPSQDIKTIFHVKRENGKILAKRAEKAKESK